MSNFERMNAWQIAETIMNAQDPNEVTPLFLELNALHSGASAEVIDLLENTAVVDIRQGATMASICRMMTEITGQPFDMSRVVDENGLTRMHVATQVYMNVSVIRGDAAHPLVKAYAEEVAKLSADEYYSPSLLLAAERAVQQTFSAPRPVFRDDPPPPKLSEILRKRKKGPRHFEL